MVLGDARFMLMIVVYSGFWILYFQNFGSVLWYLRDFVDPAPVNASSPRFGMPLKFDAEHVTVVNAGTIILLQVLVSRIVKNVRPLPTMVDGHRHRRRSASSASRFAPTSGSSSSASPSSPSAR